MAKLKKAFAWAASPDGRKDLGALVALVVAIYTGIHAAGV